MNLTTQPDYEIKKARYAKGMLAISCKSDGSGYKTRAMRICSALNARWSNREKAYIISITKTQKFLDLYKAGKDVDLGNCSGKLGYVL